MEDLIKKVTELAKNELKWEWSENDYGDQIDSLSDSFGEVLILSYCEPEDAIWGRDLSVNFDAGFKLGIRNAIKVLKENPEFLNIDPAGIL